MPAPELPAAALEGGRHGVDVVGRREQQDGRGALGHVGPDLVEERIVELGHSGLRHAAGDPAADDPDREPGRPEEHAGDRAGQGALRGLLADRVELVVDVDVAAGERAAHHEAVAAVVLDEGDLVDPGDVADGVEHVGVRVVGAFDVGEHRQREVEAHGRHATSSGRASASSKPGDADARVPSDDDAAHGAGGNAKNSGEANKQAPPKAGLVLAALIMVAAVANLNLSVANVALPSISARRSTPRRRRWI